jgi:hypothetical protein
MGSSYIFITALGDHLVITVISDHDFANFIAVCNNVGDAAFLGPNQKIENPLPQASYIGQFWS